MKANDHGYVRYMKNYQRYYEHQQVWEAHNGPIPAKNAADCLPEIVRLP